MNTILDKRDPLFLAICQSVIKKIGTEKLTEDELLLLACEEISRTSTYKEKRYEPTDFHNS